MVEIFLSQGKMCLIDDEDFERVRKYKWCFHKGGYAYRVFRANGKSTAVIMHRFILNTPKGLQVDHVNGNGLDNRKCNLRLATPTQNTCNTHTPIKNRTGYRGVRVLPLNKAKPFGAQLYVNRKRVHMGTFVTAEEAARAYDKAATRAAAESIYGIAAACKPTSRIFARN